MLQGGAGNQREGAVQNEVKLEIRRYMGEAIEGIVLFRSVDAVRKLFARKTKLTSELAVDRIIAGIKHGNMTGDVTEIRRAHERGERFAEEKRFAIPSANGGKALETGL